MTTTLIEAEFDTDLIPGPLEYAIFLPDGYDETSDAYPLLYILHGGGGSRDFLSQMKPSVEELTEEGKLPKLVVVTPSALRSFYMDYSDGSQQWETLITGSFLTHLRATYNVRSDRQGTLLFGISMGGMGALRMGFKHPDIFGGLAALEPGIEPELAFGDIKPEDRFYRPPELYQTIYGNPVDEAYWKQNNPANIALKHARTIAASGLEIYLECGDQDGFGLDRGAEFLHRILRDNGIGHEYHLVRGADHVGATLASRSQEGLAFLNRVLNPPPADPQVESFHNVIDAMRNAAT
ncbi:MAG: alpha/beta hydrolase-fold protein [Desulfobacterales bacterium]